jgi:hypothetical protein
MCQSILTHGRRFEKPRCAGADKLHGRISQNEYLKNKVDELAQGRLFSAQARRRKILASGLRENDCQTTNGPLLSNYVDTF